MAPSVPTLPLKTPSGALAIPVLGVGTCLSRSPTQTVLTAMKLGYRHIDTAQIYGNESEIGVAIEQVTSQSASSTLHIPREELFITSKLWEPGYSREGALEAVRQSCEKLSTSYIDLYLIHTPRPGRKARHEAWLGLQDAMEQGLVKAIGVSNWAPRHIEQLMGEEGVKVLPSCNQIECHVWQQQRVLRDYCKEKGIVVVGYSPLAQAGRWSDECVKGVVERRGRGETMASVLLKWCLQRGLVVVPKSDSEERLAQNLNAVEGEGLSEDELMVIDKLDEGQKGNVGEWDPFAWD